MPTVYNQAISCRFGVELADQFSSDAWTRFDTAVAWVRRSGIRHLMPALTDFLQRGGEARFVVGIDIENTSKEGLEALLSLESSGNIETFIHHDEHQTVTFHPKVYLFSGDDHARLIIGSNNLTESGLYTNTEAGLQVDAALSDPVIVQMRATIDSWSDTTDNLARRLDAPLLAQMEASGYVSSEDTLNRRRSTARRSGGTAAGAAPREPLFGSRAVAPPPPPAGTVVTAGGTAGAARPRGAQPRRTTAPTSGVGSVLLIRPRLSRGGTQMQFPIPLRQGPFLQGVDEVYSDHDKVARPISGTHPERGGGTVNTYKMEVPEGLHLDDPVMRIWRAEDGRVFYHVYDADTPDGGFILQRLEEGRHTNPPLTTVTKPSTPERATWYRFI